MPGTGNRIDKELNGERRKNPQNIKSNTLRARLTIDDPEAKFSLPPVCESSCTEYSEGSFVYILSAACRIRAELRSCDRDHMAHKT